MSGASSSAVEWFTRLEPARARQFKTQASAGYYGVDKSIALYAPDWPKKGAPQPIPRDPDLPDVSQTTVMFFAASALVIFGVALVVLLH